MNLNMAATAATTDKRPPIPPIVILRKNNNNGNGLPQIVSGGGNVAAQNASIVMKKPPDLPILLEYKKHHESADGSTDDDGVGAPGTSDDAEFKSGRIRKRRYSMARIQPTRIKKVMQSDEDIGRMVASVPVAIGSAMEIFAERLLQGAADALQHSTTKTLSPIHIKQAVSSTPHFAFLEPILKDIQLPVGCSGGGGGVVNLRQQGQHVLGCYQPQPHQQQEPGNNG